MSKSGHSSKPSLGLAGDRDQLSHLDKPKLTAKTANIQLQDEEDSYNQFDVTEEEEPQLYDDDDGEGDGTETAEGSNPLPASDSVAISMDPSMSGEYDPTPPNCVKRILAFPALSLVFPITFFVSIFCTMINVLAAPNAYNYLSDPVNNKSFMPSPAGFAITFIFTVFLVCFALLATRQLLYQLFQGEIKPMQIVGMYLATIVLYGDLYQICLLLDVTSFSFQQGSGANATTNVVSVWVAFQYFSVTTITCTGYGDIAPRWWFPKVIAATELLMSLLYHIGIFSVGLEHFQNHIETISLMGDKGKKSSESASIMNLARNKMRDLRSKYPRLDAIRKFFIKYVFACSIILQIIFLIILNIYDSNMFNRSSGADSFIIFLFFIAQIVQFALIVLMTLALIRQISKSYVSPGFLIQSWLATVSLFAGLYVLLYLVIPGFNCFYLFPADQPAPHAVVDVIGQFFWFSLCTMTTTGYGDVFAVHMAARIAVCVQMIMGVCYTVVILGQALASTVGFINQIRLERGASLLKSVHSKPDPTEEVETLGLQDFEGETPAGEVEYESELSEAEEVSAPPPKAAPVNRKAAPAPAPAAKPQPQQQQKVAKPAPAKAAATAAASSSAVSKRERFDDDEYYMPPAPQPAAAAAPAPAPTTAATVKTIAGAAAVNLAKAGAASALKVGTARASTAIDAAATAAAPTVAAAQVKATQLANQGAAKAKQGLNQASAALEKKAPGLQANVKGKLQDVAVAAEIEAEAAAAQVKADPRYQAAAAKARPMVQQAKVGAAQAKAKAAAVVQHAREQSRGMFDPSDTEETDSAF